MHMYHNLVSCLPEDGSKIEPGIDRIFYQWEKSFVFKYAVVPITLLGPV